MGESVQDFPFPRECRACKYCDFLLAICQLELHLQRGAKTFQFIIERQDQGCTWAFQLWKFPLIMLVVKVVKEYCRTTTPIFCRPGQQT